ncbi:60S ribosomal protein L15-like [Drosophila hydei]|uniref:Ribosomal protein L15 n=1 Tax=Drosophila hydei TaxID=7224 RepID=A0A6J1M3C6_DROHY|nr:60S ribosomal protein L15-like [Drosophila hydei]
MRYFIRIRVWHCRHMLKIQRSCGPARSEKSRRLGTVVYRIQIRCEGRKRPLAKASPNGKSKSHNVKDLNPYLRLQAIIEERIGRRLGDLRMLNSHWVTLDDTHRYFEVILVDINLNGIRRDAKQN